MLRFISTAVLSIDIRISVLSDSRTSRVNNSNSISDTQKPSHIRTQNALSPSYNTETAMTSVSGAKDTNFVTEMLFYLLSGCELRGGLRSLTPC